MTAAPKGREQWLTAGQDLLRRGGVAAVKLQALTEELGLTTGSFYHHFEGMGDYLDQLAHYYGTDQVVASTAAIDDAEPRVRLRRLYELSLDADMGALDSAMRDWAGGNEMAARAVRSADAVLLRFIERAFLDLGCSIEGARVRAHLMLSAGVARVAPPWRLGPDPFAAFLSVLEP